MVYRNSFLTKFFLGLIAFVFIVGTAVMFGPGSWNFGLGNYAIKVGDIVITPKEYRLQVVRLQKLKEGMSEEEIKLLALRMLVGEAILAYLAEKDGFYTSSAEIKARIEKMFSVNGTFSPELLKKYLSNTGLTAKELEEILKKQILADKYRKAVYRTAYAEDKIVELNLLPLTTTLRVQIYTLTPREVFNKVKVDENFLKEFYEKTSKNWVSVKPERVAIYKVSNATAVKELYQKIKEGKTPLQKPLAVIMANETANYTAEIKLLAKKVFENKGVEIKQVKGGYLVAVYQPEERKPLSFEELKKMPTFVETAKTVKALQYINGHRDELSREILNGTLKVNTVNKTLSLFELMNKFGLGFSDLFALLEGKKIFKTLTPNGLVVIKVISTGQENLKENTLELIKNQVKQTDYNRKLQALVNYYIRTGKVKVEVNKNLLPKYQR